MSKFPRDEAPTLAPKFDMESYARESERLLAATVEPSSVPVLIDRAKALQMASLPTESFLLAFIDGRRDVQTLAALSGIPRDLVAVTITDLVREGVVTIRA